MGYGSYLRDLMLRQTLLNTELFPVLFLGLHAEDPGDSGAQELTAPGYTRQPVTLVHTALGTAANINVIEFPTLPEGRVAYFSLWDTETGGWFLLGGPIMIPVQVLAGNVLRYRETELVIRVG